MRGDCLQVATLIDVEGIAEIERERRLVPLHIECEGTRPGMHAVGVNGDSVSRSALRRTFDKPQHHLVGDFEPMNAVVVRRAAVLGELIDARLAAVDGFEVVRAWPQRGTLHFLAAEDARWLMRLCNPRVARAQAARRPGRVVPQPLGADGRVHQGRLSDDGSRPFPQGTVSVRRRP